MTPDMISAGISASFGAAFLIGLSFGSGPCNLSCLPYLGPVLLGPAAERPMGRVIVPFMSGRLTGYALLGLIAALAGQTLEAWLAHPVIPVMVSLVTLWLAWQLYRQSLPEYQQPLCTRSSAKKTFSRKAVAYPNLIATDGGSAVLVEDVADQYAPEKMDSQTDSPAEKTRSQLFVLGFSLALNPCVPLLGLLAAAAQTGEPLTGTMLALAFGVGAVIIPVFLVRFGVALLGQALRDNLTRWQTTLTRTGAILLVIVAISSGLQGWHGILSVS